MTCIVGVTNGKKVFMGADSFCGSSYDYFVMNTPKVFKNSGLLIGSAGCCRVSEILEYTEFPRIKKGVKPRDYLIQEFVPIFRQKCKEGGILETINNVEGHNGIALIGIKGELFMLERDFSITDNNRGFSACGSGEMPALGALYVLFYGLSPQNETGQSIRARMGKALECAMEFTPFVKPPFICLSE